VRGVFVGGGDWLLAWCGCNGGLAFQAFPVESPRCGSVQSRFVLGKGLRWFLFTRPTGSSGSGARSLGSRIPRSFLGSPLA